MPGRPRKKRIRAIGKGGSSTRVSNAGSQASCSNCKKPRHNKASCKDPVVKQTPKPKGVPGRLRKKQSVGDVEDVDVVLRGPVRDKGVGGSRGGVGGSRGGAGVSRGGAGVSRRGVGGSRGGAGGSRGCAGGGLEEVLEEPEQTQDEPQQTQHEPVQTQDEDQVEQTQEQAEIDLTQVEQTQEQTQDQVQPQEQPQQVTLRTPSARILQKKLEKQGSS
ncbi:hypothetical protein Tco_0964464 [Tanacetum coccineum]